MRISRLLCTLVCAISTLLGGWPAALMAQGAYTDRNIALYQHMIRRQPFDAGAYYRLGDAYIQKARQTGDVMYYGLAEEALRKALDIAPGYSQALRHLAHALYSRHAFAEAAVQAAQAIAINPADGHAYGVLGDACLEVGKYPQAQAAYHHMLQIQQDLYSYSRMAGFKSLRGDPHGAIADLERAMQAGLAQQLPQESIAWVQWQLGNESFALGDLATAESRYQQSLETFQNSHRALAALAHVRAAQQRYEEAIALYRRALAIIPLPDYATALGDVYRKTNQTDEAAKQYALVEYIGHLNGVNQSLYNRELAVFYADHDIKLSQALDFARQELDIRQDIYAHDLLAWALYKNGRPEEALVAITEALQQGTQDAKLFFHAGMIYHRLGDIAQAKTYLERALALNPHFHLFHADVARHTLTELGTHLARTIAREQGNGQ
jgi:tetratricopeptide (TPR) repeat protein